jgi:NADPH:quinone reductase-like Zn-dependent oxidoreductase
LKKILLDSYGDPAQVARCAEAPDVGEPASDEVVFDVLAFPINPADISFCKGNYRLKPPLPATPGAECVGRVAAVGASVSRVSPGDLVINLDRENWAQRRKVKGDRVIVLPAEIDIHQAAMIRINPPTAMLLLDLVDTGPGDWIIQNVANSAVGKLIVALAVEKGVKTVNVVRRPEVFDELKALGADVCVVDQPGLDTVVAEATGGARVKLGIDAVAGEATHRIASCVMDGGTVCTYGSMSGESIVIPPSDLVYRGLRYEGFLLGRFLDRRSTGEIGAIYDAITRRIMRGQSHAVIERVYPINDIKAALTHAQRAAHSGKILVAPSDH